MCVRVGRCVCSCACVCVCVFIIIIISARHKKSLSIRVSSARFFRALLLLLLASIKSAQPLNFNPQFTLWLCVWVCGGRICKCLWRLLLPLSPAPPQMKLMVSNSNRVSYVLLLCANFMIILPGDHAASSSCSTLSASSAAATSSATSAIPATSSSYRHV